MLTSKTKTIFQILLPALVLGLFFVGGKSSFAQTSPCSDNSNLYIDPKAYCPFAGATSIAFVLDGATAPDTSSHETGFGALPFIPETNSTPITDSSVHTVCCCKADDASYDEVRSLITSNGSKTCPTNVCKGFVITGLPAASTVSGSAEERAKYTPRPCDQSLTINSQYSPLKPLSDFVGKWYAAFFYLAVVLAIIQIFRGGFEYAIAAGNSSKTEEAKGIIVEAVIGLAVALLAAGILVFLRGPKVFLFQ